MRGTFGARSRNTLGNAATAPQRKFILGAAVDEPIILDGIASKFYYHTNAIGSTDFMTDGTGATSECYAYGTYGHTVILAPDGLTVRSTSSVGNPSLFTGRRFDSETGLLYYRARIYDSQLGRFLSRDPFSIPAAMDLYLYVNAQPLGATDPSGMEPFRQNPVGGPEVCGFYVWLYTGLGWCVPENVYNAAMQAAGGVVTCWWDCEVAIHTTVVGPCCDLAGAATTTTFTHLEIGKFVGRRGIGTPGSVTTLQSQLAYALSRLGYKGIGQQICRRGAQAVSKAHRIRCRFRCRGCRDC